MHIVFTSVGFWSIVAVYASTSCFVWVLLRTSARISSSSSWTTSSTSWGWLSFFRRIESVGRLSVCDDRRTTVSADACLVIIQHFLTINISRDATWERPRAKFCICLDRTQEDVFDYQPTSISASGNGNNPCANW